MGSELNRRPYVNVREALPITEGPLWMRLDWERTLSGDYYRDFTVFGSSSAPTHFTLSAVDSVSSSTPDVTPKELESQEEASLVDISEPSDAAASISSSFQSEVTSAELEVTPDEEPSIEDDSTTDQNVAVENNDSSDYAPNVDTGVAGQDADEDKTDVSTTCKEAADAREENSLNLQVTLGKSCFKLSSVFVPSMSWVKLHKNMSLAKQQ